MTTLTPSHILAFWFEETTPEQWWSKDDDFDALIAERFGALHAQASAGELWQWRLTPQGRLAEILVLDQFSRNLFREDARAFAADPMSLALAQEAVACGDDLKLNDTERHFLYLPYMHSESQTIHEEALRLYKALGKELAIEFELKHKTIIDRFGRYPHRNAVLGRKSTEEEIAFSKEPGSSF